MIRGGYTYIVTNNKRSVFYTGVTSNLLGRISQHRDGEGGFFTRKYNCKVLLYYEFFPRIEEAIAREKKLKKWRREWKLELIRKENPDLKDLYDELLEE